MVQNPLTDYISQNLQLGYDARSIKESLLQSGYEESQINAALDYVIAAQNTAQNPFSQNTNLARNSTKHTISKKILIIASILFLLIITATLAVFFFQQSPTVAPPPRVDYGSAGDIADQAPAPSRPNTSGSTQTTRPTQSQNINDPIPYTPNPESQARAQQIQQQFEYKADLTRLEIDEKVNQLASSVPQEATQYCDMITTRAGRFACFSKVALQSADPEYCELIDDQNSRDSCYIRFPINDLGDTQVCDLIVSQYNKENCLRLYDNMAYYEQIQRQNPFNQLNQSQTTQTPNTSQTASTSEGFTNSIEITDFYGDEVDTTFS